jgi:hypothetical protein
MESKMVEFNEQQMDDLKEAFRCACNLNFADTRHNHSTCGSFHIHPFNTKWDEETAKDVMYHVQLYVNSWIVQPLSQSLGIHPGSVEMKEMIKWHRNNAHRLERMAEEYEKLNRK